MAAEVRTFPRDEPVATASSAKAGVLRKMMDKIEIAERLNTSDIITPPIGKKITISQPGTVAALPLFALF
jgi:hypothetical protein